MAKQAEEIMTPVYIATIVLGVPASVALALLAGSWMRRIGAAQSWVQCEDEGCDFYGRAHKHDGNIVTLMELYPDPKPGETMLTDGPREGTDMYGVPDVEGGPFSDAAKARTYIGGRTGVVGDSFLDHQRQIRADRPRMPAKIAIFDSRKTKAFLETKAHRPIMGPGSKFTPAIPSDVYYSRQNQNFYFVDAMGSHGLGNDFYDAWCQWSPLFPVGLDDMS
jgi:hypothetical protein